MIAFFAGLIAGWSVQDGLVPALQGPISTGLLGGADLSWLFGIVVSGAVYLVLGRRTVPTPATVATGTAAQ
jgi:cytosine/uracil/thiamine/allantoin permease